MSVCVGGQGGIQNIVDNRLCENKSDMNASSTTVRKTLEISLKRANFVTPRSYAFSCSFLMDKNRRVKLVEDGEASTAAKMMDPSRQPTFGETPHLVLRLPQSANISSLRLMIRSLSVDSKVDPVKMTEEGSTYLHLHGYSSELAANGTPTAAITFTKRKRMTSKDLFRSLESIQYHAKSKDFFKRFLDGYSGEHKTADLAFVDRYKIAVQSYHRAGIPPQKKTVKRLLRELLRIAEQFLWKSAPDRIVVSQDLRAAAKKALKSAATTYDSSVSKSRLTYDHVQDLLRPFEEITSAVNLRLQQSAFPLFLESEECKNGRGCRKMSHIPSMSTSVARLLKCDLARSTR